jgi:hypothetical protein
MKYGLKTQAMRSNQTKVAFKQTEEVPWEDEVRALRLTSMC